MGNAIKSQEGRPETNPSDALKVTDYDNLVVLADYPCRDISEPIFKMGEILRGLSEDGCWWRVRSFQTGTENYIPNNHVAKVYHGWLFEGVARQKAEELLRLPSNTVGSFLIRESPSQRGVYSLSVRHRVIKHYKIFRMANSWYYISPRLTFQCLEDMVNHYSECSDGICCVLTSPCLSLSNTPANLTTQAPPVVMRRNFDWRKVERSQLLNPSDQSGAENRQNTVSFGVRNSIAAYLSVSDIKERPKIPRSKKSKSVYVMPDSSNMETEEDNE
ncbi:src like adaptor 1a [Salminus brasiliensis]|uniref:src like adaptor 1a n=1 Tax=Salminus brasiliensis TaxID=930266 RepID=UPI003B836C22